MDAIRVYPLRLSGVIQGRGNAPFSGVGRPLSVAPLPGDWRMALPTTGVIAERVMVKPSPTAPEVPLASARIWVQRLADGRKAWEGFSDAQGNYRATGLEVDVWYVITGIDTSGQHKCEAAGPVQAKAVGA